MFSNEEKKIKNHKGEVKTAEEYGEAGQPGGKDVAHGPHFMSLWHGEGKQDYHPNLKPSIPDEATNNTPVYRTSPQLWQVLNIVRILIRQQLQHDKSTRGLGWKSTPAWEKNYF